MAETPSEYLDGIANPDYAEHRLERIPHRHTADKADLELSDEMTCADFVAWVKANLAPKP